MFQKGGHLSSLGDRGGFANLMGGKEFLLFLPSIFFPINPYFSPYLVEVFFFFCVLRALFILKIPTLTLASLWKDSK